MKKKAASVTLPCRLGFFVRTFYSSKPIQPLRQDVSVFTFTFAVFNPYLALWFLAHGRQKNKYLINE